MWAAAGLHTGVNAFAAALAQGLSAISAIAGESVVYARGGLSVTLTAVAGKGGGDFDDAGINVVVLSTACDWILLAGDLVLGGSPTLPQRGDTITTTDGRVYQVNAEGEQVYSACDPGQTRLRVRAKLVEAGV